MWERWGSGARAVCYEVLDILHTLRVNKKTLAVFVMGVMSPCSR